MANWKLIKWSNSSLLSNDFLLLIKTVSTKYYPMSKQQLISSDLKFKYYALAYPSESQLRYCSSLGVGTNHNLKIIAWILFLIVFFSDDLLFLISGQNANPMSGLKSSSFWLQDNVNICFTLYKHLGTDLVFPGSNSCHFNLCLW